MFCVYSYCWILALLFVVSYCGVLILLFVVAVVFEFILYMILLWESVEFAILSGLFFDWVGVLVLIVFVWVLKLKCVKVLFPLYLILLFHVQSLQKLFLLIQVVLLNKYLYMILDSFLMRRANRSTHPTKNRVIVIICQFEQILLKLFKTAVFHYHQVKNLL